MSEINHSVPRLTEKQEKRFWGKVVKGGPNECWKSMIGFAEAGLNAVWRAERRKA